MNHWQAWLSLYFLAQLPLGILLGKWIKLSQASEFQFDEGQHPHVDSAGHDNSHPRSRHAGATYQVTA